MEDLLTGMLDTLKQFKAASSQQVSSFHSDAQNIIQSVNGLENTISKAEQVAARIENHLRNEPRIPVDRAKMWVGASLIAALLFFVAGGYAGWRYAQDSVKDAIAEYNAAAAKLPDTAKWAVSAEGVKAKKLIEMNSVDKFLFCTEKGWKSEKKEGGTYCYPERMEDGSLWGWRIK
jgi:hypothetical protein